MDLAVKKKRDDWIKKLSKMKDDRESLEQSAKSTLERKELELKSAREDCGGFATECAIVRKRLRELREETREWASDKETEKDVLCDACLTWTALRQRAKGGERWCAPCGEKILQERKEALEGMEQKAERQREAFLKDLEAGKDRFSRDVVRWTEVVSDQRRYFREIEAMLEYAVKLGTAFNCVSKHSALSPFCL
jgi:hypothetical protein